MCLANEVAIRSDQRYGFGKRPIDFGIGNCTIHHICSNSSLFSGKIQQCSNIGVRRVSGLVIAEVIGTIESRITDFKGMRHVIRITKVVYLPSAAKNIISVSQWNINKQDDAGNISKQQFSIFNWGNE